MIQDGGEEQNDTITRLTDLEKRTTENEKRISETRGWLIAMIFMLLGSAIAIRIRGVISLFAIIKRRRRLKFSEIPG